MEGLQTVYTIGVNIPEKLYNEFRIGEYITQLKIEWLAYETQRYYVKYLKNFIEFAEFRTIWEFNNIIRLRFWYYNLSEKGIQNNTIWKYYKCIRKYYKFLKEIEIVENILIDKLPKIKCTRALPKSLSEEEVIQIRKVLEHRNRKKIDIRDYVMFETFLNTWIRRSELWQLKIWDITSKHIVVQKGKWWKDRIVHVSSRFSRVINDYRDLLKEQWKTDKDYLFWGISLECVSLVIRRISQLSNIHFSPHLLRHTYASLCIKKGVNLYTLQQQLWHTDLKTTSVYLYLNGRENWEEIQKLNI